jgi:hypothetical protein
MKKTIPARHEIWCDSCLREVRNTNPTEHTVKRLNNTTLKLCRKQPSPAVYSNTTEYHLCDDCARQVELAIKTVVHLIQVGQALGDAKKGTANESAASSD